MIDKLVQEFKEHEVILERGLKFEIDYIKRVKIPYLPASFRCKAKKTIYLHQPTLATLAAIGREFLLFDIQEQIEINKPFTDTTILADKTAEKMARVIAVMATGITDPEVYDTEKQDKEITAVASIIFYNVKPVMLLRIVQAVRLLCNVENFTSSISLMSEIKMGLPTLVGKED
jgi:hypothetical protein